MNDLWASNLTLSEGVMESLDEEAILKIIELALSCEGVDDALGFKVCPSKFEMLLILFFTRTLFTK
jgi:hypothetical protein